MQVAQQKSIVFGVFKGMGDLLWASSVIRTELDRGVVVHLLLFPSSALADLVSMLDFGEHRKNLHMHPLPTGIANTAQFLADISSIDPEFIWISPHAPARDSSWRIPLVLSILQRILWPDSLLVGAASERFSWLFSQQLPLDRSLPLVKREWSAYSLFKKASCVDGAAQIDAAPVHFISEIMDSRNSAGKYDLVIHPGANATNRRWPAGKYAAMLSEFPETWRIVVAGLPSDIAEMKAALPAGRQIEYISGSLRQLMETFASAKRIFVMDSGTMHFASILGVPTVAIFGQQDPAGVIAKSMVDAVYERSVPCQPCGRAVCSQTEVFCLTNLDPIAVAHRLIAIKI